MNKLISIFFTAIMAFMIAACEKPVPQQEDSYSVNARQSKYFLTAEEDLKGKLFSQIAGVKVILTDSKCYAVGERVLSVSYAADKPLARVVENGNKKSESYTVTMTWESDEPVSCPRIGKADNPGGYGLLCLPGRFNGKFTVKTNRYTYEFKKMVTLKAGQITEVTLDFAEPLVQPKRKVGIMGDSISTFEGTLCNAEYHIYYPDKDPNVSANPSIAVNSKEKTYWYRLIYDYMENGELDVNSSWSGSRVIHDTMNGRHSKKTMNCGFVDRAYDFVNPDIIIIHGGTNDKNMASPLGEYTWDLPVGQGDLTKFRSAYIELIKKLQGKYEGVQIILIIGDYLTTDYEQSILEIAKHFGLPYVNFVGVQVDKCASSHPTSPAFDMMARTIYETCKDYLP